MQPIHESDWPADLQSEIEGMRYVLNVHRLIANNPALLKSFLPLRNHVVDHATIPDRAHELLILRTAYRLDNAYEWAHHTHRGGKAGLTDDEIQRAGEDDLSGWQPQDALYLRAADDLLLRGRLSDETAADLIDAHGEAGVLDVMFTIGVYRILATMMNTYPVEIDVPSGP